jgi:hypothetical protein
MFQSHNLLRIKLKPEEKERKRVSEKERKRVSKKKRK